MRAREWVVWAGSLLSGAMMGLATGVWQMATESAQVQAGLIAYPLHNSFYLYHLKIWTLSVQIPAILLALGLPEPLTNALLTAGLGALCFSSLALLTFALCRRTLLSLTMPFLVVGTGIYDVGTTYFIALLGSPHTFGVVGTAVALLTLASIGLRRGRLSWFLLGLAPAVHPAIGSWLWMVVAIALATNPSRIKERWRFGGQYAYLGLSITILSFVHHLYISRVIPPIAPEEAERYLTSFIAGWDDHRSPVPFFSPGILIGFITIFIGTWWPRRFPKDFSETSRIVLRLMTISAGMALFCSLLSHFQAYLPNAVRMAMPWRNLNITSLAFGPLVFALAALMEARRRRHVLILPLGIALQLPLLLPALTGHGTPNLQAANKLLPAFAFLYLIYFRLLAEQETTRRQAPSTRLSPFASQVGNSRPGIPVYGSGMALSSVAVLERLKTREARLLLGTGVMLCMLGEVLPSLPIPIRFSALCTSLSFVSLTSLAIMLLPARRWGEISLQLLTWSTVSLTLLGPVVEATEQWEELPGRMVDRHTDPVFQAASQVPGLILTASDLTHIQLRTRRPILLNGFNLNSLPYVLESGPDMEAVLNDVYGISLFHPPGKRVGGLAPFDGQPLWESRSAAEWRRFAGKYNLGGLLAPSTWKIQLPLQVSANGLSLYGFEVAPNAGEIPPDSTSSPGLATPSLPPKP